MTIRCGIGITLILRPFTRQFEPFLKMARHLVVAAARNLVIQEGNVFPCF